MIHTQSNNNLHNSNTTIYPHPPQIVKVHPFSKGSNNTVAGVLLRYGPVFIRAFIVQSEEGALFLSMPGRKNEKGEWWDSAFFSDRTLSEAFSTLAVAEYQKLVGQEIATELIAA